MDKILSIIIPTYNMEKYLDRCLSSLIVDEGIMDRLEVLVINDGSKDRSSEIAHGFAERYPDTFVVVDKENGHYGSCVNKGLELAAGKYVKILDADDRFDTVSLEKFISLLQGDAVRDVDCFVTDYTKEEESDGSVHYVGFKPNFPENEPFPFTTITSETGSKFHMWAITHRTDNLRTLNYRQSEGIAYTDQEWMFLPFANVEKMYYFPASLYRYTLGRDGQTMSKDKYAKDFWMEVQGAQNMAKTYYGTDFTCGEQQRTYLQRRMVGRLNWIYKNFLLLMRSSLKSQRPLLIEFDEAVEGQYRELYDSSDKLTVHALFDHRYIHIWRHRRNFYDFRLVPFYFCYYSCRVLDKFQALLNKVI